MLLSELMFQRICGKLFEQSHHGGLTTAASLSLFLSSLQVVKETERKEESETKETERLF